MGKLQNKVAVITGDMWGIPLATAKLIVEEGGHVFLLGMDPQHLNDAVKTVGKSVTGVQGQPSNLADLDRLYDRVRNERGWIDIVFANPISAKHVALQATTKQEHESNYNNCVRGPFLTVEKALPLLLERGSIILNTFLADSRGLSPNSADRGAIAALRSLAHAWATELKDRGIRVNAVNPGPIESSSGLNHPHDSRAAEKHPTAMAYKFGQRRRLGTAQQVAEAVVFLASEESSHITETELSVESLSDFEDLPLGRLGTPEEIAKAVVFLASDASNHITGKELFVGAGFAKL